MLTALALAGTLVVQAGTTPNDPIVTYLESAISTDPTAALAVSAPHSDAARYAVHQSAFAEAVVAAGYPWVPATATSQGDGQYQMCQGEQCGTYADFTTDDAGLLMSFTVEGSNPAERLGSQTEAPATSGPVTARVRSSFRSEQSNALFVTVELSTEADVNPSMYDAVYVGRDGRQVTASFDGSFAPDELFAGANTVAAVMFPEADLGGTLRFVVWSHDFTEEYTFALAVPAFVIASETTTTESPTTTSPAGYGNGTWVVGVDIEPGWYRADVPMTSMGCSWARLSDPEGLRGDVIANGIAYTGETVEVEILNTDVAFDSFACGTWERVE